MTPQELEGLLRDPTKGHENLKAANRLHILRMMYGQVAVRSGGFRIHLIPGCLQIVLGKSGCNCGQEGLVELVEAGCAGKKDPVELDSIGWDDNEMSRARSAHENLVKGLEILGAIEMHW